MRSTGTRQAPIGSMKQQRRASAATAQHCCNDDDWLLQKADAIKGFLAQQPGRTQQSSQKTAWLVAWEQLAAEGELAAKQLQQVLQPSAASCADVQQDLAELAVMQQQLADETQEINLQLLGQAQELCSLVKRAITMGVTDLSPSEAATLASLQQELKWLQQDTEQHSSALAAAAQDLISGLTAVAPGSCGATAGLLDGWQCRRVSGASVGGPDAAAEQVTGCCTSTLSSADEEQEQQCTAESTPCGPAVAVLTTCQMVADPEAEGTAHTADHDHSCSSAVSTAQAATMAEHAERAAALEPATALAGSTEANAALEPAMQLSSATGSVLLAGCEADPGSGTDGCSTVAKPVDAAGQQLQCQRSAPAAAVKKSEGHIAPADSDSSTAQSTSRLSSSDDSRDTTSSLDACTSTAAAPAGQQATHQASSTAAVGSYDSELQELLMQHPLAPSNLKQEVLEAYCTLLQKHRQLLEEVTSQQRQHAKQCSGWSADEHALFVWHRARALHAMTGSASCIDGCGAAMAARGSRWHTASAAAAALPVNNGRGSATGSSSGAGGLQASRSRGPAGSGKGCSKGAVVDHLALAMPSKSRQQLERHEAWYAAAVQLQRRTDDLVDGWSRQRTAYLSSAQALLEEASKDAAAAAEAAAARLSTAVSRQLLHDQLAGIHLVKQEQLQAAAALAAAEAAAQAERAAAEAALQQQRNTEQREHVLQYKQHMALQQLDAEREAELQQQVAARAAQASITANRPIVQARQTGAEQRLKQQHEQARQRAAEIEARRLRLAAIAADLAPRLDRDAKRAMQPTAASCAAAPVVGQAFKPVHGFTAQQVVSDPRFRLVEALWAAGPRPGGPDSVGYLKAAMARLSRP